MQVDSSLSRQYGGTGLGLALVRQIAELHGGNATVQSELGQGSCFTVRIPEPFCPITCTMARIFTATPPTDVPSEQIPINGAPVMAPEVSPTLEKPALSPLILLAEDNEANVETLVSYLETQNYRLIRASDGQEAIDLTRTHHPNLILMDIQMPGVDGLTAIRQLRAHPDFAQIPIIALTALVMTGDQEKCLAAGASEYLAKPVSLKQLKVMIHQLLQR
ncbi:hypothetical protein BST81_19890 [Leptolyngbya sp. 'hensonii']|nr:hypothetical protein BST81_19890 [Leptolyngbya sp. 'hensonii']